MEKGIIPLRYGSLPGAIRLPKRYEQLSNRKGNKSLSLKRVENVHVQPSAGDEGEKGCLTERLDDLMQAIIWVKQELIFLRQHDILLKRQFCDIQDTIHTLQRTRNGKLNEFSFSTSGFQGMESWDITLDNYFLRSASSATALNDSYDTVIIDGEDDFRPRTSSMKTTRDLAALARRRGSKELI
ncbi:hypothetical protein CHS0354_042189 [Potamilus streckersoni]|nr:hypothetical protein CHS0354_042189 [Potamilus streckersoni]